MTWTLPSSAAWLDSCSYEGQVPTVEWGGGQAFCFTPDAMPRCPDAQTACPSWPLTVPLPSGG